MNSISKNQTSIILLFVLISGLVSCSNPFLTEKEKSALQYITQFYGGKCNLSKNISITNGKKEVKATLEISGSEHIKQNFSKVITLPLSNIAYIFYSRLDPDKTNYTHIKVSIKHKKGSFSENEYTIDELKKASTYVPALSQAVQDIKNRDYPKLHARFDTTIDTTFNIEKLKAHIHKYEEKYGIIDSVQFQGFAFIKKDNKLNEPMIIVSGILVCKKTNAPFCLYILRRNKKIWNMKYNFY